MRITFLGNFGVSYSSETHHKKSLEALGHEVIALQEGQATTDQILESARNSDMLVWVHTHGWKTPETGIYTSLGVLQRLKELGIPTLTYHLDLWFGLVRQKDLEQDPFYKYIEYFFTCDKLMADYFNEKTDVKGVYLPAGVFQDDMKLDLDAPKTRDIIFVGSKGYHPEWTYRPKLINWLKATYGDRFTHVGGDGETGTIRGEALTKLYNETKIAIGDSLVLGFKYPYYWSDRLYETAGRGCFQIFPQIHGIQDQYSTYDFKTDDGGFWDASPAPIELVTYSFDDFSMLKQRIDYYLEHDAEREEIRKNAYERTLKDHTYLNRWQFIIDKIEKDKNE